MAAAGIELCVEAARQAGIELPLAEMTENIPSVVRSVMDAHPCEYRPGAYDRIVAAAERFGNDRPLDLLDRISKMIEEEEVYCPSLGIDRR